MSQEQEGFVSSDALGIFQGDVIIRTALITALRDLRAHPERLNSVFGRLDAKERQRAKDWFLATDIPVVMVPRLDESKIPCITIALAASDEAEVTLGDVHYVEREQNDSVWPALTPPFVPRGYVPTTRTMQVAEGITDFLVIVPGMFVVDRVGRASEITEVDDQFITIADEGLDLASCVIKGRRPAFSVTLESVQYKESYQIGVHAQGEPVYLSWLHAIVTWSLLRYKQDLLEARGFERSVFSSADFDRNQLYTTESVFSRYINCTGYVRQYWPKDFSENVQSVQVEVHTQPTESSTSISTEPEPQGMQPSEILLRRALINALKDLRANPWLLDYVFLSLRVDQTTNGYYEKELERAREWFTKTEIPVLAVPYLNEPKLPCITVKLLSSAEAEVTLGDVHYVEREDATEAPWLPLGPKFTPSTYDPATGIMGLSLETQALVPVHVGLMVIDAIGGAHEILELVDDDRFRIAPTQVSFKDAVIKGPPPSQVRRLESVQYRDSFQIGVNVGSEPIYLTWLHSIVTFCLLRYKQTLLEAEGVERSVFSSTDFARDEEFQAELVFTRYMNFTGYVRHTWEKALEPKITRFDPFPLRVIDGETLPPPSDPNDALWVGEDDVVDPV